MMEKVQKKGGIASLNIETAQLGWYLWEARRLGKLLGEKSFNLGGSRGLVGLDYLLRQDAESAHTYGATVIGATPTAMPKIEGFTLYGNARIVPDMHSQITHERTQRCVPGTPRMTRDTRGIACAQPTENHVDRYYAPLKALIENGLQCGFIREPNSKLVQYATSAYEALDTLA
ncbi:hypothetical protein BJ742DRAFT_857536 [Cladochytrium replicatum]|nr:hypothetical protein BJ742DRAFT_857536 [Cladochytrium replicatum]